MNSTTEEFQKIANSFLSKPGCTKFDLSKKLGINTSYFSKLYHAKKPVTLEMMERLRKVAVEPEMPNHAVSNSYTSDMINAKLDLILSRLSQTEMKTQKLQDEIDHFKNNGKPHHDNSKVYRVTFDVRIDERKEQ